MRLVGDLLRYACIVSLVSASTSFLAAPALADSPWQDSPFGAPLPVPSGSAIPFPPLPGNPVIIIKPGLPGVLLPGSNSRYGGMLPQVSTSSVDFDITEHEAPGQSNTVPTGQQDSDMQFQSEDP
ncbi:MAG: hypothetical protein K2W95_22220 [Candidatus Obscuribacterales bacterium]|nr:hypothetical protein [Candidatus Obscuribacterales bacterium]